MEKIAVDLEKLLDDFEFHEEQRIDFTSKQPALNAASFYGNANNYVSYPRHNFEQSSFEPVAQTDSNITVASSQPSAKTESTYSLSSDESEAMARFATARHESDICSMTSPENSKLSALKSREFKPDLIESNSDICNSLNEFDRFERHLPDIASTDVEVKVDEKVNFDLITDSAISDVKDCGDVETSIACTESESSPTSADRQHALLTGSEKLSKIHEHSANKVLIEVPAATSLDDYREKSEVEIEDATCRNAVAENVTSATLRPLEEDERTSLNLNTCTGSVAVVELIDKSDSDGGGAASSEAKEVASAAAVEDDAFITNNGLIVETATGAAQSVSSDLSCLREIVAGDATACMIAEDEKTSATDATVEQDEGVVVRSAPSVVSQTSCDEERVASRRKEDDVESSSESDEILANAVVGGETDCESTSISASTSTSDIAGAAPAENAFAWNARGSDQSQHLEQSDVREQISAADAAQTRAQRPDSLNLMQTTQNAEISSTSAESESSFSADERRVGKEPPVWIPDSESSVCMHCQTKFTLVRRRHHCRACGFVLCSKCCDQKASLEYLKFEEARVCHACFDVIERANSSESSYTKRPNPNNPMEYCSTIPPLLQVGPTQSAPPSVLVPVVGVLKREGRSKTNDTPKQVIFSDGIRPGGDLTELDAPSEPRLPPSRRHGRVTKRVGTPPGHIARSRRILNPETHSFIPSNQDLPPLIVKKQCGELVFTEMDEPLAAEDEPYKFAINRNLFVLVKRITLDCCVNRDVWCMTTEGLSCVGQDEVVFILQVFPDEKYPPKDVFSIVNMLYQEASKGSTVTELSFASAHMNQLFDSKEHGGFVFVRPTYQCIRKLLLPQPPFLIALLIHKWEAPWARLFPIRLILRLGAEFRYYPCPLVSVRNRPALFTDIGNTIIGLLADFRKYSYSLPTVRGLMIHMEDRLTTILLPRNRYDQVIRAMNNSGENVLAFAGNISTTADSHLVCIQSVQNDISYHTQAINIHNKPRQITGASFVVFNGSLKQCSWTGKSNIVEDGLMVQIPSESMTSLRAALREMNDYCVGCGPQAEERVVLKWTADDINFNIGVKSQIDGRPLDGVPSIRVHNGTDYSGASCRLIRWTEVFILQSDEDSSGKTGDTVNISKLSESIARATSIALVPLLDLLATANLTTIAVRATIHPENVGYEAGSCGEKLRPLYMKRLDDELIAVVHEAAFSIRDVSCPIVLELIFKIMEQG